MFKKVTEHLLFYEHSFKLSPFLPLCFRIKKVTEHFSGEVGLNLLWAWLLPVAVAKLHDGDLYAVGWGEGP